MCPINSNHMTISKWLLICFTIIPSGLLAQATEPAMADAFRQDGKIYVVIAVVITILLGIFTYLFLLDRKISKIEKELDSKSK